MAGVVERSWRTELRGGRLLVEAKESSLEKILIAVRAEVKPQAAPSKKKSRPSFYPIPILNALAVRNFRATQTIPLAVSGRHLPLVYRIASGLASPPHNKALLVFDMEHRFDATRLTCDPADLRHIHVHRPARRAAVAAGGSSSSPCITPDRLRELVASVEKWMSYGDHRSGDREFWGSIVVGALGAGDVTAAWRGWLRVERAAVNGFPVTFGVQEALADREARQEAVDGAPWAASSRWGDFSFTEAHPPAASSETSAETRDT